MEQANNTFTGGMILDINELDTPSNTYCINALNATVATFNGNEGAIQNEMGNVKIPYDYGDIHAETPYAQLSDNSIVLGSAEYGGVIYYVLLREHGINEIGSFPSPNWSFNEINGEFTNKTGDLIWNYSPLYVGLDCRHPESIPTPIELKFEGGYDTGHAVNILVEPSFDGSVNLILNDGINPPRMINSGFQVTANNKYEIIERYNSNNTNRYTAKELLQYSTVRVNDDDPPSEQWEVYKFDELQMSLYRNFDSLSKFVYEGTTDGGNLKVGNYVFYAVSCDKDGNESDIICESGVISIFIGKDGDPFSVNGGVANENSYKCIKLTVEDIDSAYSYIKLYYTRTTAQNNQLAETLAYKIDKLYEVESNGSCTVIISGTEITESISVNDLNTQYFNANTAKAQALNQNMLFLANVEQNNNEEASEYDNLKRISVNIIPKFVSQSEITLNSDYETLSNTENTYYFTKFIYEKTGYHDEEYYRFGIVYIRKDGSLTPVFNTLGYTVNNPSMQSSLEWNWNISFDNHDGYNNAGVVKVNYSKSGNKSIKDVIGVKFELPSGFKDEISDYKGFFFVRQKRIPTILAQGYVTNVCEEAYLPSININATDNSNYYYTYESFVTGNYIQIKADENQPIHPNKAGSKNSGLALRNNYKSRLFTLTDNSYVYFDRLGNSGPMTSFYKAISGDFSGDELIATPGGYEIHGFNEDQDDFLTICSNDNDPASTWHHADFYHFIKVDVVDTAPSGNGWVPLSGSNMPWNSDYYRNLSVANNDDQNKPYVAQQLYYNNNTKQFQLLDENKSDTLTFEEEAVEKNSNDETWYCVASDDVGEYSEEQDENGNKFNDRIYRKWHYIDDNVNYAARYISTRYSSSNIKVGSRPWNDHDKIYCPLWIEVEGKTYTYLCFGPGAVGGRTRISNESTRFLTEYVKDESENVNSSNLDTDSGYDLTVPTFDGKYGYLEEHKKVKTDEHAFQFKPMEKNSFAIFCPEYELNRPYYNNLFTGNKYSIRPITEPNGLSSTKTRLYKYENIKTIDSNSNNSYLINVQENVSLVSLLHNQQPNNKHGIKIDKISYFSTRAGTAQEVNFKFAGAEFLAYSYPYDYNTGILKTDTYKLHTNRPFNIVRGIYSPYVGMYSDTDVANTIINIYAPENGNLVENRAQDSSPYYAISDRISINKIIDNKIKTDEQHEDLFYRGDCYIGYFTHRVNRNFQDPTSPYNDTIIDSKSFSNGFKECFQVETRTFDTTKEGAKYFNLGDINAIQLGSWVTFPVRSTMNICLRAVDRSYVDERLLCGNDRSFYPIHGIDASGSYKIPESDAFNAGFNKSGSERIYFNLNQLVYNKVYYKNRIVYSNVLQSSSLKNENRIFLAEHYKDYTEQYGEIVKLISLAGNLLVICEHGIMLVPVNERALAAEGDGGNVFINTSNVLPDNPKIISDTYGSKWEESVINTPYGVYGIDESSKKIWYTNGDTLELISDFKVQEFLNNWLKITSVKEIGKHNIKSHYIKYKNDVIFTLYDFESEQNPHPDVLWNLCWNINERQFRTFYSWLPLDSQNIGNNLVSVNLFKDKGNKNYLWKHGHSFRVPSTDRILPTNFYGEQHPFEFEFVVRDNPGIHKIFDNLQIISNKAAPESFHYEIVGECYNFGNLKKVAYIRQELLKKIYSSVITNLKYDNTLEGNEVPYDESNHGLALMFPQYYSRQDIPLQIYDSYKQMTCPSYDYNALSGTELVEYNKLNEYRLWNHVKAVDVRDKGGLLRGNMYYKEDKWDVQINPINYLVRNEAKIEWKNDKVPVDLTNIKLGQEYWGKEIQIPQGFGNDITNKWNIAKRKEVAVKDKFIKIRIRYTGNELAIISAVNTLYRLSYA